MPDKSAQTKVREALRSLLGQIESGAVYWNDVLDENIYDEFPEDPESIDAFPSIVMLTGSETRDHYDNETLYISMKVPLVVFVQPEMYTTTTEAIERIKQDIQCAIGNNPGLPDDGDVPTCQLAIFGAAEPFGNAWDIPEAGSQVGVKIDIDITYQQTFADPTVS